MCRRKVLAYQQHYNHGSGNWWAWPNSAALLSLSMCSITSIVSNWTCSASCRHADVPLVILQNNCRLLQRYCLWYPLSEWMNAGLIFTDLDASTAVSSKDIASWSGAHSSRSLTLVNCVCRYNCAVNWPNDTDPDRHSQHILQKCTLLASHKQHLHI